MGSEMCIRDRIYIFDSEFAKKCSSRELNADIADTRRTHIHEMLDGRKIIVQL